MSNGETAVATRDTTTMLGTKPVIAKCRACGRKNVKAQALSSMKRGGSAVLERHDRPEGKRPCRSNALGKITRII